MTIKVPLLAVLAAASSLVATEPVSAHGFAGKRFFPATLATDDPFVADELSLPTIAYSKQPASEESPATRETDFSIDVSKRVTENLGIGLGATYKRLRPDEGETRRGFDNLAASVKYKFYQSDAHETLLFFFGKGFGDLPAEAKFLRPFAVTGLVGVGIPSRAGTTTVNDEGELSVERHPHTLEWGFAIEYSLPYLQAFVQDVGLREPFNRMIPVVEFAMSTALDRGASGTTGTVNPGIIWAGQYVQLAVEAVIPVNSRSGSHVGWIAQLHFFLDDLFPTTIGRPILANEFGK
ncbi:MAG: hypothetical protein E6H64_15845 [Betaproteobacteria bacterium]|nr:MAG: hypothetical protein E6H64_15845 [Betaproteobacteria bacterium]